MKSLFRNDQPAIGAMQVRSSSQLALDRLLPLGAVLLCLLAIGSAQSASAAPATNDALSELRRSFTLGGKPVPPEIFRDLGDGDLADSGSIWVTVDVRAAIGSNLYADDIKTAGAWVTQTKPAAGPAALTETSAYKFVGSTGNGLLVVIASYSGGGTGNFYTLHILDAGAARGFAPDGRRYERLDITEVRSVALGDRWDGAVRITGDAVAITTTGGVPAGQDRRPSTVTITAERP